MLLKSYQKVFDQFANLLLLRFRMKPADLRIATKPSQLSLGEAAGFLFHFFHHFGQWLDSLNNFAHLAVADAAQRFKLQAVTPREQAAHFIEQPVANHRIGPAIDQIIEFGALAPQTDLKNLKGLFVKSMLVLPRAQGAARALIDFQGANNS